MNLITKSFDELTTRELYEILKSREIFVMDQKIHYLDMDNIDYRSLHCFFLEDHRVAAYLRAYVENNDETVVRIGRVLTLKHGAGIGKALMTQSIEAIKSNMKCKKIVMDAQKHAVGFYEKFGFLVTSEDFLEEGVIHQAMELEL